MTVVLGGCVPGGDDDEEADGDPSRSSESVEEAREPERLAGTTDLHNAVRASPTPAPSPPLADLTWDGELAAVAQAHADRCVYGHSRGDYGENLYAGAGRQATPADVVGAWAGEASQYDLATGTCSGKCGHYTQIVWRDTQRVGCGVATCRTGSPFQGFSEWEYWVCNYDPIGNWQGERPY